MSKLQPRDLCQFQFTLVPVISHLDTERVTRQTIETWEVCGIKVKEGRRLHCPVSSLLIHIIKVRKDSSVLSASVVANESSLPHVCLMIACLHSLFSNTSSQTVCGCGVTGQCVLNQSYCGFYYRHFSHKEMSTFAWLSFLYVAFFYDIIQANCTSRLRAKLAHNSVAKKKQMMDKMISHSLEHISCAFSQCRGERGTHHRCTDYSLRPSSHRRLVILFAPKDYVVPVVNLSEMVCFMQTVISDDPEQHVCNYSMCI